jgi:dTDP-4-amino-4,6-dideoxygalactose transaminase
LINVTKAYLPPLERYQELVRQVFDSGWLTNNGQMLQNLESKLVEFLGAKHFYFCANGTITLQIAIKVLGLKGQIITTPFSYVATTNAILWENCEPVFVDIDSNTFCINADLIESAITNETVAILATHVYGLPCDVEKIARIADKYGLKVIYDAAHAFGANYKGKSLLTYGDISSCSFHATKIFHTVEGGCLVTGDDTIGRAIYLMRQFGHEYDDYYFAGINGKNSEMHAAMGLAMLPDLSAIFARRKEICDEYNSSLSVPGLRKVSSPPELEPNYAYYPIIFEDEDSLSRTVSALNREQIMPRRYFYPSLNTLPFLEYQPCPVSEKIANTVLCLPLYYELSSEDVQKVCTIINTQL